MNGHHRFPQAHGIPRIGTLGIMILATRIGRIAKARAVVEELRRAGPRVIAGRAEAPPPRACGAANPIAVPPR